MRSLIFSFQTVVTLAPMPGGRQDSQTRSCMPKGRQHRSSNDPQYETRMKQALDGLFSGEYNNISQAARAEGVKNYSNRKKGRQRHEKQRQKIIKISLETQDFLHFFVRADCIPNLGNKTHQYQHQSHYNLELLTNIPLLHFIIIPGRMIIHRR